ncbi:MAG TPA: cytochrome b [Steroidobacteraceae bacterium]
MRNTSENYGSLAKFLHWTIVILIISQYVLAETADDLPNGLEKLQVLTRHRSFGMLILGLALARIAWKLMNRGLPAPVGEGALKKAAAAGHGLLYLLILLVPVSGWAMSSAANYPVTFFGWFQFPSLVAENHDLHELLEEVHETLFYTIVVVAVGHALAALYHHYVLKDDVLRRMLPFRRK